MLETLSVLIHGNSKVGKSTLAATAPPPMVIFDAEGSTKFLPLRKVVWDPLREGPPAYDGSWQAAVVNVHNFDVLAQGLNWLRTGQHQFRSLIVDSASEAQRKLKTRLVGPNKMQRDNWDELLRHMDDVIRGFRDLTQHPTNPIAVTVFIAETKSVEGKYHPALQGQFAGVFPYLVDVFGYLWVEPLRTADGTAMMDEQGRPAKVRRLLIAADNPLYAAGERVQGRLPDVIDHPNIQSMYVQVYPHLAVETTTQGETYA